MSVVDLNFLPVQKKRWYLQGSFYLELSLFVALLALIAFCGFYRPLRERQQQAFLVSAVKCERDNYHAMKINSDEIDRQISESEHRWKNVQAIMKCTPKEWIDVINDIDKWLDGPIKITSYVCDGATVSLSGTGISDSEVASFAKELESSNEYYEVSVKSISYSGNYVSFQMSGKIAWEVQEHE